MDINNNGVDEKEEIEFSQCFHSNEGKEPQKENEEELIENELIRSIKICFKKMSQIENFKNIMLLNSSVIINEIKKKIMFSKKQIEQEDSLIYNVIKSQNLFSLNEIEIERKSITIRKFKIEDLNDELINY